MNSLINQKRKLFFFQTVVLMTVSFQASADEFEYDESDSLIDEECGFDQSDFENMISEDRIADMQEYYLENDVNLELLTIEGKAAEPDPGEPPVSVDTLLQMVAPKKDTIPVIIPKPKTTPTNTQKTTSTKKCKNPVSKK